MKANEASAQPNASGVLEYFESRRPAMLAAIEEFASIESPSSDRNALELCAVWLDNYLKDMTGRSATWHRADEQSSPHLQLDLGDGVDILLIGHFDTVHPIGTLEQLPIRVEGDRLYGPGVLDMKSGVVMMAEIAKYISDRYDKPNVRLFITSDEEVGSTSSSPFLKHLARGATAALVFESTFHEGVLKAGARGVREVKVTAKGKAGHAAYPEHYVNPVDALGDVLVGVRKFHKPSEGVVISGTVLQGSTAMNAVPETASVHFSVRGANDRLLDDVEKAIRRLRPTDPRIEFHCETVASVPTLELRDDNYALALAKRASKHLGLVDPVGIEARGASDANQLVGIVPHALEGLGGWGDGLHDPLHEHIRVSSIIPSVAMAAVMTELSVLELSSPKASNELRSAAG